MSLNVFESQLQDLVEEFLDTAKGIFSKTNRPALERIRQFLERIPKEKRFSEEKLRILMAGRMSLGTICNEDLHDSFRYELKRILEEYKQ